jgi:alpha-beta hydrolase superfamily lysophospholipase
MTPSQRKVELRVDVAEAAGIPGAETAVTAHLPGGPPRAVVFAFPGRGYARSYYDLQLTGGYSEAEHHLGRGVALIACDHLGVGDSTIPDLTALTMAQVAAANDATVKGALAQLGLGRPARLVGAGQSMGGCLLTVQQAGHRTFDAVALLGWSGIQTVLPLPPDVEPPASRSAELMRYAYHWEDVPDAIAVPDAEWAARRGAGPDTPWRSATGPEVSRRMLERGIVAAEAAAIDVPVFLGIAERDVCPDPLAEPSAYRSATDVTLFIQPRAAHMHNFAGTRALLWDRLAAWIDGLG